MLSSFAFSMDLDDRSDPLDAGQWRAIALGMLGRSGEALVVCDSKLGVLFASTRATKLLQRLGSQNAKVLPDRLATIVRAQLAGSSDDIDRLVPAVGNAMEVQASSVRSGGAESVTVFLREETLQDTDLFEALRERYAISMRGFQIALLIRKGLRNREIAERLTLAESTVKIYVHQLYKACGVSSRTGLIALLDRLP